MQTLLTVVFAMLLAVVIIAVGATLMAPITWWAWNGTMPMVFGLPSIGFWVALKLNVLSGMLIKSSLSQAKK